jgi:mRNA-degrading endonuclease HigB of HigAB toxin-antitoxin module
MGSVDFKCLTSNKNKFRAEIGRGYRVMGYQDPTDDRIFIWDWLGTHAEYDSIIDRR